MFFFFFLLRNEGWCAYKGLCPIKEFVEESSLLYSDHIVCSVMWHIHISHFQLQSMCCNGPTEAFLSISVEAAVSHCLRADPSAGIHQFSGWRAVVNL